MDIKKPQLVKVEAFVNFFNGSFATPSQQHGNQQSECEGVAELLLLKPLRIDYYG